MLIKPGVRILGVKPELLVGLRIAESVWEPIFPGLPFTLTAVVDGTHKAGSLHYAGLAADFRTHDAPPAKLGGAILEMRTALGPDFDCIIEDAGGPNEHGHLEHQPKTPI